MLGELLEWLLIAIFLVPLGYFVWALVYPVWYHVNDGNLAYAGITALVILLMFGSRSAIAALLKLVLRH